MAKAPEAVQPSEVIVVSTLHQFHTQMDTYTFGDLAYLVERLSPDILALELTQADVAERRAQRIKQEYPRSIYPLLERQAYFVVPLEPDEPTFSELVSLQQSAVKDLLENEPGKYAVLNQHAQILLDYVLRHCTSAEAASSPTLDALCEVKHTLQEKVLGPRERDFWGAWNRFFLDKIVQTANDHAGKRIVIVVGFEHGYWLSKELAQMPAIKLLGIEV